jgi:hypothetical protein
VGFEPSSGFLIKWSQTLGSSERFRFSAVAILNISCRHSKQFELTTNETVSMFDHSMYNHSYYLRLL